MELEFRKIHIDMLAIPLKSINTPLSSEEMTLSIEFNEECAVTRGVVLASKRQKGLRYSIVHGLNVVRAAGKAGIEHIPCLVTDVFTDLFIDLIKSQTQSEKPASSEDEPENAISIAIESYQRVLGTKLSFRKAAQIESLGKKSTLYDEKRLAKNLSPEVQALVRDGRLSKSAGRNISYIERDEQYSFALKAAQNNWTVRDINLARSKLSDSPADESMNSDILTLQVMLEDAWGAGVSITPKTRQTGSLHFDTYNIDDVIALCSRLSKLKSAFSYSIKGNQPITQGLKSGVFEVKYNNLEIIEELKGSLLKSRMIESEE